MYMRHFSPNRPSRDPHHYICFFLYLICCKAPQKNILHEVLDLRKKFLGSISPKITQKAENDTVGRHRF